MERIIDVTGGAVSCGPEPDSTEAWNNRGAVRYARGDVGGALADFDRALELRPDYPEALNNRGIVRQRLGAPSGALADFDRAVELRPRYAEALNNRAVTRLALGDLTGAVADFDRGIGIRPDYAEAYHGRAAVLHALGDFAGALADYDRVLGLVPHGAAPVHHLRAAVFMTQHRFADAAAACARAVAIDPNFCMAYVTRGSARYHLRDPGALDDYTRAFELDARAAVAEVVRVLAGDVGRGGADGLENCRKHIRICPADPVAYARRCITLVLLAREDEAARDAEEFLRRAPHSADFFARILRLAREQRGGLTGLGATHNRP